MASYTVGDACRTRRPVINEIRIRLPALSANESVARAVVAAFCAAADPTATELADIKCAVSEAVTNCIVHAYREGTGDILLTARLLQDRLLCIEIRDRGCGIPDLGQAREPLYTTDAAGERSGMGFTVMESFCDGVRVSSTVGKGTTVTPCKRLRGRSTRT